MKIKTNLAKSSNYGVKRNLSTIKYIVIHYTANDGDSDEANGNYFHNNYVGASAHYFVDSDSITQSVPDNYVAYSVGAKTYRHKECRNGNSISIELCDDRRNGTIYPSEKTIENALELTKDLMKKYNIPQKNVIRHYDVTGKHCPAYWVDDGKWKSEFWNRLVVTTSKPSQSTFKVKVTCSVLNVRKGAGTGYKVATTVKQNEIYTIVETKNGWGKLKSGAGWIYLQYTKRV